MDEIYWAVIVIPLFWITKVMSGFDARIVDGIVNGVGYITLGVSIVYAWFDKWVVDGLVNLIGMAVRSCGRVARYAQTGVIQNYLLVVFLGVLVIAAAYLLR
jgi:NADH-quinone oxidoreductase subunit L